MKSPFLFLLLLLIIASSSLAQLPSTVFESSNGAQTATYHQVIDYYRQLDKISPKILMKTMGMTDAGYPLHVVCVSADGQFNPALWHKQGKVVILINNGIHPGEPDGIDASMLLARDIATGKVILPRNVALAFIPVYNIGGCLNRSPYYRVDQNGPDSFGFRGNSQNLDLNRDFIKSDSKEARAFAGIYHFLDPDVFIDNHVSNGADYQHVMTLIASQHNKLGGPMGEFMNQSFEPGLYRLMKEKGYDLLPYVNFFGDSPDNGWPEFFDSPRYSSGYATLFNSFGFTPETHMLKPYPQRVQATYALMQSFIQFTSSKADSILKLRKEAKSAVKTTDVFTVRWQLDSSRYSHVLYKGYTAGRKPSAVSGLPRLYYDRSLPFEKTVKFYNHYKPSGFIIKPHAYIIPQGWWKVIDLLKINQVKMTALKKDTVIEVEVYTITDYKTSPVQYEMHHVNSGTKVSAAKVSMPFRKGDVYIPLNQEANRFLVEVLEPEGNDSYFAWNFFDAILGQKEGTSNYVFEETAAAYVEAHPELRARLEAKRLADTTFAKSASAQLDFVFKNSPYYEPAHRRYPVYRVMR